MMMRVAFPWTTELILGKAGNAREEIKFLRDEKSAHVFEDPEIGLAADDVRPMKPSLHEGNKKKADSGDGKSAHDFEDPEIGLMGDDVRPIESSVSKEKEKRPRKKKKVDSRDGKSAHDFEDPEIGLVGDDVRPIESSLPKDKIRKRDFEDKRALDTTKPALYLEANNTAMADGVMRILHKLQLTHWARPKRNILALSSRGIVAMRTKVGRLKLGLSLRTGTPCSLANLQAFSLMSADLVFNQIHDKKGLSKKSKFGQRLVSSSIACTRHLGVTSHVFCSTVLGCKAHNTTYTQHRARPDLGPARHDPDHNLTGFTQLFNLLTLVNK
ncbi:unnamed protein product [Peronospora belbahrii]|uniref:Uncharacterized protein n=1 Tax=Peronospora belbahrii TaxID=622444 RepID=A0AAU9KWS0_9STRA|nr:unnamed protein product [Peronospora belbahrii]